MAAILFTLRSIQIYWKWSHCLCLTVVMTSIHHWVPFWWLKEHFLTNLYKAVVLYCACFSPGPCSHCSRHLVPLLLYIFHKSAYTWFWAWTAFIIPLVQYHSIGAVGGTGGHIIHAPNCNYTNYHKALYSNRNKTHTKQKDIFF